MVTGTLRLVCLDEGRSNKNKYNETPDSYASLMMRHLLLLCIAQRNMAANHWTQELVRFYKDFMRHITKNNTNLPYNKNLYNDTKEKWDEYYEKAKKDARMEREEINNPIYFDLIPEKCPWTIDHFIKIPLGTLVMISQDVIQGKRYYGIDEALYRLQKGYGSYDNDRRENW